MEGIPHGNRLVPAGGDACQLQRDADSLGASGAEERLLQGPGRDLGQLFRQVDGDPVGVAPRAERQLVDLALDGGDHFRVAEADLVHVVAVEVHVASALGVFDVNPLAGAHGVQAWRREGLPQKVAGVLLQQGAGFGIQVFVLAIAPAAGKC